MASFLLAKLSCLRAAAVIGATVLLAMPSWCLNRDALRQIVQEQCLVHWTQQHDAAPCVRVEAGFAVLPDRKGGAHFLLIPTKTIAGIESPELAQPDAANYFSAAWQARDQIAAAVGHSVARGAIGLAVNPARARSQDQLHIHIECLRSEVARALQQVAERITSTWSPVSIEGANFAALRIMGEELNGANPFELLAHRMPEADQVMGDYTLVVAGMQFEAGPGFIVLTGTGRAGELLLDSTCAVAGTSRPVM